MLYQVMAEKKLLQELKLRVQQSQFGQHLKRQRKTHQCQYLQEEN